MSKIARQPDYKDLDLDFIAHPTTKDVVKKTGVDAIRRSVRNLVLTNFYDKPFRSYVGSNVRKLLFENINPLTQTFLKDAVEEVIRNHEPRVQIHDGGVKVYLAPDYDGFNVTIDFTIVNTGTPVRIALFLERIR